MPFFHPVGSGLTGQDCMVQGVSYSAGLSQPLLLDLVSGDYLLLKAQPGGIIGNQIPCSLPVQPEGVDG